jgi:hypothetical protein
VWTVQVRSIAATAEVANTGKAALKELKVLRQGLPAKGELWPDCLGAQSRHMVHGIESESFWLFCPELTNAFERREAAKALQPFRKL